MVERKASKAACIKKAELLRKIITREQRLDFRNFIVADVVNFPSNGNVWSERPYYRPDCQTRTLYKFSEIYKG